MKKIKEVIKLKQNTDLSDRQIAKALSISRPLIQKYWKAFQDSGLNYEQIATITDSDFLKALEKPQEKSDNKYETLLSNFPAYFRDLKNKGVTLQLLWEEYRREYPDGYKYSQFCYHYQIWRNASEITMHIEHKAGDKMFVDYAGTRFKLVDPKTGKEKTVETFVAILGSSGYTYVEASKSQEKEEWVRSNERALWYWGGVTQCIVPDNLRSAVSRSDPYEPGINPLFDDFADHYGTVIVPARVRKPQDKALVENAVKLAYQRIYAPLRNKTFHTLEQLNEAIWELLEKYNKKQFQRLEYSREDLFKDVEYKTLMPLPPEKLPIRKTIMATVQSNYHIEIREDRHYYSVPYYMRKVGKKIQVKVIYDQRNVSIYYDNIRIAQYQRDKTPNGYTTNSDHMPSHHKLYAEWNPERIRKWADTYGNDVRLMIDRMLESRKHPEQAFKVCMGLLNLCKKHPVANISNACRKTILYGSSSLKRIRDYLKQMQEDREQPELEWDKTLPCHENIRGSHYYN